MTIKGCFRLVDLYAKHLEQMNFDFSVHCVGRKEQILVCIPELEAYSKG